MKIKLYGMIFAFSLLLGLTACEPDTPIVTSSLKTCYKQTNTDGPILCFNPVILPKDTTQPNAPDASFTFARYENSSSKTPTVENKQYKVDGALYSLTLYSDPFQCASIKFVGSTLYLSDFAKIEKDDCKGAADKAVHKWEITGKP